MNTNKSLEKKLTTTTKKAVKQRSQVEQVLPQVSFMDERDESHANSDQTYFRKCSVRNLMITALCLGAVYVACLLGKSFVQTKTQEPVQVVETVSEPVEKPLKAPEFLAINTEETSDKVDEPLASTGDTALEQKAVAPIAASDLLADLDAKMIRDSFDTQEENFIESQIGEEFSHRPDQLFQSNKPYKPNEMLVSAASIRSWIYHQHIQGVAYKGFDSCMIINSKVFHIGDVVNTELNVVWTDIDPAEKKLYFEDESGNSYVANY